MPGERFLVGQYIFQWAEKSGLDGMPSRVQEMDNGDGNNPEGIVFRIERDASARGSRGEGVGEVQEWIAAP